MSVSLSVDNTPFVTAFLCISTDLDLEDLGRVISSRLAGGAKFGGREQYIRDEIPAIYVSNLLGGRLILEGKQREYRLCLEPIDFPHQQLPETAPVTTVDLSGVLATRLQGLHGIRVELGLD